MKKLILTLVALMPLLGIAQVKFTLMTFAEAQEAARKAGKELLVDVARGEKDDAKLLEVCKDKELAKFLKANFLPVRIDMNNEKNKDFGQYLYSLMYPCVVFYTNRGEQLESTNWYSVAGGKANMRELAQKSLENAAVKRNNTRAINFRDLDFKQALEVAKTEGKLVFVDNYTTWCRPCKQMEMDVFTLNSVADYYNEHFVSIKLDADKDPHNVAKNNGVRGFPGYLYFAPEGDVIVSEGGFNPEKQFIAFGEQAVKLFNDNKEIKLQKVNLDEAKALAKKENKMIFVDLSATWCGPCKQLKATTFKEPAVARFYNSKFVSMYVECDIQKELAEQMKKAYGYSAFPTMLYLNADGELIHKYVGAGMKGDEFIEIAKTALENRGLKSYNERYEKGERSAEFIKGYVGVLGSSYEADKAAKVSSDYLNALTIDQLLDPANFNMMKENVKDLDAKPVQLALSNKDKFPATMKKDIDSYEYMVWSIKGNSFVSKKEEKPVFDKAGYSAFMKRLKSAPLTDKQKDNISENSKLNNAEAMGDWKTYVAMTTKKLKGSVPAMISYNWALRVAQKCSDGALKNKFAAALEESIKGAKDAGMFGDAFTKVINNLKQ